MRALAAALLLAVGCPRVAPTPSPPRARLLTLERDGLTLRARLAVVGGPREAAPVAVDWALVFRDRDLVRGRAPGLEFAIPRASQIPRGAVVRLRGAVHFEGAAFAPFDELARVH
jgi:hypothetical protein